MNTTDTKTYSFPFPGGGFFLPPGAIPNAQLILDPSPQARQAIMSVNLFDVGGNLTRVPAGVPGIPFVIIGFEQQYVGGQGGGQGPGFAQLVAPDVPVAFVVPAGKRIYANARGATVIPLIIADGFLALSVTAVATVEPAADGQTKRIVDGIKAALVETVPQGILSAARQLGMGAKR